MSGFAIENNLCYQFERDYSTDADVKYIFKNGVTSLSMLKAIRMIKRKENSRLMTLPLDLNVEKDALNIDGMEYSNIEDLSLIADIACSKGSLHMVLECIEITGVEDIMLKVQGPFSCLLSVVGSNTLYRWIVKYEEEVQAALDRIVDGLANYMIEAIKRGANIISLADPSGMKNLLGEKKYKKFVADYLIKLLKKIEPYLKQSIVHLCPLTSIELEKCGLLTAEIFNYDRDNYAQALVELAHYESIQFVGHRCINAEKSNNKKVYVLSIRDGD